MDYGELHNELDRLGLPPTKFEEWAELRPDKTFFYYGEENRHLTYGQFNQLANNLAFHLQSMGVGKGDRVSLFLLNPLVIILSMYALWKIGAVFCPINLLYKGRLLSYQLNDTVPKVLITEQAKVPVINEIQSEMGDFRVIIHQPKEYEHDFNEESSRQVLAEKFQCSLFDDLLSGDHPNPGIQLDYWDTANIIYTSGTTGTPKGVVQSFRWVQNYCYFGGLLHPDDVSYCDMPLYHIVGAFGLVTRAASRGTTVAVWDRFSASDFWERIKISQASYALLLDVMMLWLLQAPEKPEDRYNTLRRLHMLPMPEYHRKFANRFGIDFVNIAYGATEFGYGCSALIDETVWVEGTPAELQKGFSREETLDIARRLAMPVIPGNAPMKQGIMGQPSRFHEFSIVDEHDRELEVGKYGQIVIRNRLPYLMFDGYFGKPEATVEASKNLWFHTGDGGYRDQDGMIYFVDRMGGFIRVRGENISSYQIEDLINSHPRIAMSAAFPVPAEQGAEDDVVVCIVTAPGAELLENELRAWMEAEMPKYMRPKYIRFMDALPLTPTNKVEKYKLKEMFMKERSL